jgi:hypothetical protein
VVDAPLFAAAQSKIKQLGWVQGYGVHSKGVNDWWAPASCGSGGLACVLRGGGFEWRAWSHGVG